jgi:hypothetical protein
MSEAFFQLHPYLCPRTNRQNDDNDEKDNLYEKLDKTYEECPKRDAKIILGDPMRK